MTQIRPFYESDLIKVITGIRRCGKSVILKQVLKELEDSGKKCLFLDFDLRPTRNAIPDADTLIKYVEKHLGKQKLYNDDIDYSTSTVFHYKLKDFLLKNEL